MFVQKYLVLQDHWIEVSPAETSLVGTSYREKKQFLSMCQGPSLPKNPVECLYPM